MNYNLSVSADRSLGKSGYILCSKGNVITYKVSRFKGSNIKENILRQIESGLRECKNILHHDDNLYIEVQNSHLCDWLNGRIEKKDYSKCLSDVFDVLEMLDCMYKFIYVQGTLAASYIASKEFSKVETSSIDDLMSEFE